ncbi:MAG: cell division protein ZapA [Methylocystaceae bacterium]
MEQNKPNRVTVSIYGEDYVVKGAEDPSYIQMLAAYVDRKMTMLGQRNTSLSTGKIAVLVALNLADELSKLQEDYDQLVRSMEDKKDIGFKVGIDKGNKEPK